MQQGNISYELVKKRVKNLSIRVRPDGTVLVTIPYHMSRKRAMEFVDSKYEWILTKTQQMEERIHIDVDALKWNADKENYLKQIFDEQYQIFSSYGIPYPQLKFRKMKGRYGSCNTTTKVVTLNKALVDMPIECAEYVAAHELAHLIQANHSKAFYQVLDVVMPDHRIREKRLKNYALHN